MLSIQSTYPIFYIPNTIIIIKMDFHHQLTVINDSISSEIEASHNLRFISAEKWKALMLKILHKLRKKEDYDTNLIDDLITVVQKIPEEKFIETIMHIQPFKPNFMRKSRRSVHRQKQEENNVHESSEKHFLYQSKRLQLSNIIRLKQQIHSKVRDSIFEIQEQNPKCSLLQQTLSLITEQHTLSKQFQAKGHPYRLIMQKFLFLLEHKFKNFISNCSSSVEIERIQSMLLFDLNLLQEFIIKASVPYLKIFKSRSKEERMEFQIQLIAFIKKYLDRHPKVNALVKKIMKYALKSSQAYGQLEKIIPNFIEIEKFSVEPKFRINGEYSFSINALIELTQSDSPTSSLKILHELRSSILRDIDEFYHKSSPQTHSQQLDSQAQTGTLKISVETQLQIIKFLLCKGKIFLIDIMAELKYLETVLGQDDLSYKYGDSSFMYAQVMIAIQILSRQFK